MTRLGKCWLSLLCIGCLGSLLVSPDAWAATRTHYYRLAGELTDALGGPNLISGDGYLDQQGYYYFAGKSLSLAGAVNPRIYSLVMVFSLNSNSGYRKLIDFQNRTSDYGMYNYYGAANFYPAAQGTNAVFPASQLIHLVLTRDSRSEVTCYVNAEAQFSFSDTNEYAVFSTTNNLILFLQDDTITGGGENSVGLIKRLELFDGPLTSDEVAAMFKGGAPRLQLDTFGRQHTLTWTNYVFGLKPETAAIAGNQGVWTPLTNAPVANGLSQSLVITNAGTPGAAFFRLRKN